MIDKYVNSYLWIPDIMRLSGYFKNNTNEIKNGTSEDKNFKCKNNKKACPKSKIKFVKGTGRYVYWNFKPKMIIDLDWIELNSKHPINVILIEKKNKSRLKG